MKDYAALEAAAAQNPRLNDVLVQQFGRAGTVIVEKNSYKAFQRAGYGKSLGKSGIAGLITGCCVVKVSPRKTAPESARSRNGNVP